MAQIVEVFARVSMFPETKLMETLRSERKQNNFPKKQSLGVLFCS